MLITPEYFDKTRAPLVHEKGVFPNPPLDARETNVSMVDLLNKSLDVMGKRQEVYLIPKGLQTVVLIRGHTLFREDAGVKADGRKLIHTLGNALVGSPGLCLIVIAYAATSDDTVDSAMMSERASGCAAEIARVFVESGLPRSSLISLGVVSIGYRLKELFDDDDLTITLKIIPSDV